MRQTRRGMFAGTAQSLPKKAPLNDMSWDEIKQIIDAGKAAEYWAVGDCKAVTLSGTVGAVSLAGTYYVYILGFDHNSLREGANRVHFQFAKTDLYLGKDAAFIDDLYGSGVSATGYFSMNPSNTNEGGWNASQMRSLLGTSLTSHSGKFVGALPADLRAVLKPVTKYTDNTGGGSGSVSGNVTVTTDYLFLLSEYEVFGTITKGNTYESNYQAQYTYYSIGNSKIKYRHSAIGSTATWWLRSPSAAGDADFTRVFTSGAISSSNLARWSYGLAPAFCV